MWLCVRVQLKTHDKIVSFAKTNLSSIEALTSRTLYDSYISQDIADFARKKDFEKLRNFNYKVAHNKTRHVEAEKKLNYNIAS